MKKNEIYFYVVDTKLKDLVIEDLESAFEQEDEAIENCLTSLSDENKEKEEVDLFIYSVNANKDLFLSKEVSVKNTGKEWGEDYELTLKKEHDLPKDFSSKSDNTEDEKKDDESEKEEPTPKEENDTPKEDVKEEEPKEDDSSEEKPDKKKDKKEEDKTDENEKPVEESLDDIFFPERKNRNYQLMVESLARDMGKVSRITYEPAVSVAEIMVDHNFNFSNSFLESSYAYAREYNMEKLLYWEKYDIPKTAISLAMDYITEKTLKADDRNSLDSDDFGIPEERAYPIHDKVHVLQAIKMFNHVEYKHEKTLADNIMKKLKKFDMLKDVNIGEKNRFKKYFDKESKKFFESYETYPMPKLEFNVANMLPMMGSRTGWGSKLAETPIHELIKMTDEEYSKYATLYDGVEEISIPRLVEESFSLLPKGNKILDGEAKKLATALKGFIDNPKNDYMDDILKKAVNFKKDMYRFTLKEQDGRMTNGVLNKIKSCGYKLDVDDGVHVSYSKETNGLLLVLSYDPVGDKLKLKAEKVVKESGYYLEANEIDDEIADVITKLNQKGYKTKYSSSGYKGERIKKDGKRDGIYHGRLYTTARIVFAKKYDIKSPEGWEFKDFEDEKCGIYPKPLNYEYSKGMPDDAFKKWKENYMETLRIWVNELPDLKNE